MTAEHKGMKSAFHSVRIVWVEQWLGAPLRVGEAEKGGLIERRPTEQRFKYFELQDDPVGFVDQKYHR